MRLKTFALVALSLLLTMPIVLTLGDLPLIEAVRAQNRPAVQALLNERVDVNRRQADGSTALHWAAYRDDREIAELLIRAGADLNASNQLGVTPLYLACENGSAEMTELLLKAGARVDIALPSGETALMTAARSGSVRAVNALIERGADPNAIENTEGQSALMWAVSQRHPDVVAALIRAGADVHARSSTRPVVRKRGGGGEEGGKAGGESVNEGGYTPLLFAARKGELASARALVAAGADVNDRAPLGTSALLVAAQSGHTQLAIFLMEQGADPDASEAGYTALHAAVLRSDRELAQALVARHVNLNPLLTNGSPIVRQGKEFTLSTSLIGATPFFVAAKYGDAGMMRLLADAGADASVALEDGTTPLMVAAGMRTRGLGRGGADRWDREIDSGDVEFALTQEADARRIMGSGIDAARLAVALGADVKASNQAGDTALHFAAFHGFKSVVQFLADHGADVNARNKRGQTPLMMAMREGAPAQMTRDLGAPTDRSTELLLRKLGAVDSGAKLPGSPSRDEELR